MTQKRYLKILISAFFIFYLLFFIFPAPTLAADNPPPPLFPFCFTKDECVLPTYGGMPSPFEAPECRQQAEIYKTAGYLYYCYAPQPNINLQVSIGGYKVQGIGEYIKRLYTYFVGISGIVAALMIIWAGIKWLTAGGAPDRITDAKKKIANAAVGLCLLLGSYVILQTINPDLVNLKMPPIKIPRQELLGVKKCNDRPAFKCGTKYQCDSTTYISAHPSNPPCPGGIYPGECIGQNCSQAGGGACSKIDPGRILGVNQVAAGAIDRDLHSGYEALMSKLLYLAGVGYKIIGDYINITETEARNYVEFARDELDVLGQQGVACVNTSRCGSCGSLTPSGVIPPTREDLISLATCASTACKCIVSYIGAPSDPNELMPACREPLTAPTGSQRSGLEVWTDIPCTNDAQCESTATRDGTVARPGRCNKSLADYRCTPPEGESEGQFCVRTVDCATGLLCNTNANYISTQGVCTRPNSLPADAYCDDGRLCESGSCTWTVTLRGRTYACD